MAAGGLAGCMGIAAQSDPDEPETTSGRTIDVSGAGEVEAAPDMAIFRASVEARGEDAADVRDELAERGDSLNDALIEYGLDEDAITTGSFDIRERVDRRRLEEERDDPESEEALEEYTYYQGIHSLTVELEEVDALGEVIDTAVDAEADDVGRIRLTLSEERRDDLREDALANALEDANEEASFIAQEVDATLGEATSIDASGPDVTPARASYEADDGADASTQIQPDDVTVRARVELTYRME